MAKKDAKGNWLGADGNSVPPKFIPTLDKSRDAMIERIHAKAADLNKRLTDFSAYVDDEVNKYLDGAAAAAGIKRNQGGNQIFTGFSGDKRVEIKVCRFIDFNEHLQFAKQKIDNCVSRWSEGANQNLQAVIGRAFKQDRKGNIDTKLVLGLRQLKINDREWNEAMELISKAITITGAKAYKMFAVRDETGNWRGIPLDISRVK